MKKFTLIVIFICILALFSVPAFAFDSDNLNSLTVYNETGFDIYYLHVSPEDSEGWGAEKPLPAVRASLVTRWSKDQFAEGAYSYLPVGASETAAPCPLARGSRSSRS